MKRARDPRSIGCVGDRLDSRQGCAGSLRAALLVLCSQAGTRGLPSQGQLSSPSPQAGEPPTSRLHHHHRCSLLTSSSSVALRHHRHSFLLLCFSNQTPVTPFGSRFRSFAPSLCCVPLINYPFSSLLLSHHHCFCLTNPLFAPPISRLASNISSTALSLLPNIFIERCSQK